MTCMMLKVVVLLGKIAIIALCQLPTTARTIPPSTVVQTSIANGTLGLMNITTTSAGPELANTTSTTPVTTTATTNITTTIFEDTTVTTVTTTNRSKSFEHLKPSHWMTFFGFIAGGIVLLVVIYLLCICSWWNCSHEKTQTEYLSFNGPPGSPGVTPGDSGTTSPDIAVTPLPSATSVSQVNLYVEDDDTEPGATDTDPPVPGAYSDSGVDDISSISPTISFSDDAPWKSLKEYVGKTFELHQLWYFEEHPLIGRSIRKIQQRMRGPDGSYPTNLKFEKMTFIKPTMQRVFNENVRCQQASGMQKQWRNNRAKLTKQQKSQFRRFTSLKDTMNYRGVHLVIGFHGCAKSSVFKIEDGTIVAKHSTDMGYFGGGVYITTAPEYAAKYSMLATGSGETQYVMFLCIAATASVYPMTREADYENPEDLESFSKYFGKDKPICLETGYDSHYAEVYQTPKGGEYGYQVVPYYLRSERTTYREIVLKETAQLLPIAKVYFTET